MNDPHTLWVPTAAGTFRLLDWDGEGTPVLFLHGLTGVAEVWGPTVEALGEHARCLAMDQRGHGHSPKPESGYEIGEFVRDVREIVEVMELAPLHLVGHSMGARVAMVFAARHPKLLRSVAIIDIGPEAWRENYKQTVKGLDRLPLSYPDMETALNRGRARGGESIDAASTAATSEAPAPEALRAIAEARMETLPDGTVRWLASREALKQSVVSHRSRDFWTEWSRVQEPALFVRGGDSTEVRQAISDRMRATNPGVRFVQLEGVGHNIPLLAPGRLAHVLNEFWQSAH
jgi:2-(acetamidomethylene)succinate hydrolase